MNKNKNISEKLKLKKVVVKTLNTRTGIKALGGSATNNSCHGGICYTK
ncbi:MAG TPA: hypothetical protein VK034_26300 [Enhygromyxa sp.]|nr:hypothetical protein [Enhygromyxa sp.]